MFGVVAALLITKVVGLTSQECGLKLQPAMSIVQLVKGNNFTVLCDASCNGPLNPNQISWFDHYNNRISHSDRIQSVAYNRWMYIRLIILNAGLQHAGRYTCTGVVNDRVVRREIIINVREKSGPGYSDEDLTDRRGDVIVPTISFPKRRPRRDVSLHHLLLRSIRDVDDSGSTTEVNTDTAFPITSTLERSTTGIYPVNDSTIEQSIKPVTTITPFTTTTTTTTTSTPTTTHWTNLTRRSSTRPPIRGPTTIFGKYGVLALAVATSVVLLLVYLLIVLNVCIPICFKKQRSVTMGTEDAARDKDGAPGSVDLVALKPLQGDQQQNKPDSQGFITVDLDDKNEGAGNNTSAAPGSQTGDPSSPPSEPQSPSTFVSTFVIGRKPSTDRPDGVFVHEGVVADKSGNVPDKETQADTAGQADNTGQDVDKGQAEKTGQDKEKGLADKTGEDLEKGQADKTGEDLEKGQAVKTGQDVEKGNQNAGDKANDKAYDISEADEKAAQAFLETHFEFHKTDEVQAEDTGKEVNKEDNKEVDKKVTTEVDKEVTKEVTKKIDKEIEKVVDERPNSTDAVQKSLDSKDSLDVKT